MLLFTWISIMSKFINESFFCQGKESCNKKLSSCFVFQFETLKCAVFNDPIIRRNVDKDNSPKVNFDKTEL